MDQFNDKEDNFQRGVIVKNGAVRQVLLKFRKSQDNEKVKAKPKRQASVQCRRIGACPEASPPRSPALQKKIIGKFSIPVDRKSPRKVYSVNFKFSESLWTRIRKRVGRSQRRFAYAIPSIKQQIAEIDLKCRSSAVQKDLVGYPRSVIRAPVPWHQQFLVARENCSHNLFVTHPVMMQIRRHWNAEFSGLKLFLLPWTHPPTPEELLTEIRQRCTEVRRMIADRWIPKCHEILLQFKHTWSQMIPMKKGESLQQIKRFFNSLATLVSLQIRHLVYSWIDEWLAVLQPYSASNDFRDFNDRLFRIKPLLKIQLSYRLDIQLVPNAKEVEEISELCLKEIVWVTSGIQRVEKLILPDYDKYGNAKLSAVNLNEPYLEIVRQRISRILQLNQDGPMQYIDLVYREHAWILSDDFSRSFEEEVNITWEEKTSKFHGRIRKLKEILARVSQLKSTAYLNLYLLDCRSINGELVQKTKDIQESIIKNLLEENKRLLRRVSCTFESVTEKASSVPRSTSELVELANYVEISHNVTLGDLTKQVANAGKRLMFLLDYGILPKEDVMLNCRLFHWPDDLDSVLKVSTTRLDRHRYQTEKELKDQTIEFLAKLREYGCHLETFQKKESASVTMEDMKNNCTTLDSLHQNLLNAATELEQINRDENLLGWDLTIAPALPSLIEYIEPYHRLWHVALEFHQKYEVWYHGPFQTLDSKTVAEDLEEMRNQMLQLIGIFAEVSGPKRVADIVQNRIEKFRNFLSLLHAVCNPGLRERHWELISKDVGVTIDLGPEISFADLISLGLMKHIGRLEEISATATKELALEVALSKMQAEWNNIQFELCPYRGSDYFILSGMEEIQALIDDHILRAQTMHSSPYVGPLEDSLRSWEEKLVMIQDTIEVWLKVQSTWLYLEPIFSSEDIQRQMPGDAMKFNEVNSMWKDTMKNATQEPHVVIAAARDGLLLDLRRANSMLHSIQKGLHDYLEKKRVYFPRFYFLSNDELLEILSKTKEPEKIQPHLRKCFDGINKLIFTTSQDIEAMVSIENEVVKFRIPVYTSDCNGMVELWMSQVADAMKDTLVNLLANALRDFQLEPDFQYLEKYPGQALSCATAIKWTETVTAALEGNTNLYAAEDYCTKALGHFSRLLQNSTSIVSRMAVSNLMLFYIYARDIVKQLLEHKTVSPIDFLWLSRLRYYFNEANNECSVQMMNTEVPYGFEYIGNTQRLAMTPLTEKCFRTAMIALNQFKGAWLHGDPCRGKTSIIKELANALAKQCLVFNCFDGMNSSAIGRILKGVAQSGAWSCLDEFHRLDVDQVSLVANQIKALQQASSRNLRKIIFENSDINLVPGCAVFVISSGSCNAPDSIKQLFRSVSVSNPDVLFISGTLLTSYGFQRPGIASHLSDLMKKLKNRFPKLYGSASELRTYKRVLNLAGNLKHFYTNPKDEENLITQAVFQYFKPQLSLQELLRIEKLLPVNRPSRDLLKTGDLFPILETTCLELNLDPSDSFITKAAELYWSLLNNSGTILVGESMTGKSSLLKVLARAYPRIMEQLGEEDGRVGYQVISPWIFPLEQLFGYEDHKKKDWVEGVLTKNLRDLAWGSPTSPRWLILDGAIHSQWAVHLHTLLDGNRKLTLPSGDILQIPQSLRIIFETSSLSGTSPATVSRCSVIYVGDRVLTVNGIMKNWLKSLKLSTGKLISILSSIIGPLIETVYERKLKTAVKIRKNYLFTAFSRLFTAIVSENEDQMDNAEFLLKICAFAATWTIGNIIKGEDRQHFESHFRKLITGFPDLTSWNLSIDSILPPDEKSIFSYYCDFTNGAHWKPWTALIPSDQLKIHQHITDVIVPTESAIIQRHLMKIYVSANIPVLIAGQSGAGKSLISRWTIKNLAKDRFLKNFIHLTAKTDSSLLQNCIMNGLDRRRKGVYGPTLGRRCVLVIDDLSAPVPVHSSIRPPLELISHWLDNECLFDSQSGSRVELVDMNVIGLMRLKVSDSEEIDQRLLHHMNLFVIDPPTRESLEEIFTKILESLFSRGFSSHVSRRIEVLAKASVDLFFRLSSYHGNAGLPHYETHVWDLAKIFQLFTSVPAARLKDTAKLHKLWIHECCRVFGDRLVSRQHRSGLLNILETVSKLHFKENMKKYFIGESGASIDLPEILFSVSRLKNEEPIYEEVDDIEEIIATLESILDEHNSKSETPIHVVVSRHVARKVVQISRALVGAKGHVILLANTGSGRRSCAVLAALSNHFEISYFQMVSSSGFTEWREFLKSLIKRAGLEKRKIAMIISDNQLRNGNFFDDLARIMSGHEITDLFSSEERVSIADTQQNNGQKEAKFDNIWKKSYENLRIILRLSVENTFHHEKLRLYKNIFKCSTTIWFDNWPDETFDSIAKKLFENLHFSDSSLANYIHVMKYVHNFVYQKSDSCPERRLQFAASSFVVFAETFREIFLAKQRELSLQRDRYNAGLSKLQFAASQVAVMQEELQRLQPQLVDTSAETEALMVKIEQDTIEVEAQKEVIAADEALANEAAAAAQAIKDECESDLAEAAPALEAAITALDTLKPSDITLVKSMRHPPNTVKLVMEAVCIMKDISPVKRKDRSGSGKLFDDYWAPAQKLLGDLRFLDSLRAYDKDNICPQIMRRIREVYIPNPDFDPSVVRHVSTACEGLCKWVRAIEVYDRVVKIVSPKRLKVKEAEAELSLQMSRLSEKHVQLQQISDKLQALNDDFAAMSKKKKDLEDSIKQCSAKLHRAEKLIGGLAGEQERWKTTTDDIELQLQQLPAHIIISAATITYTGLCSQSFRKECIGDWLTLMEEHNVPYRSNFTLIDTLMNTEIVRSWTDSGFPSDNYSLDNAIIAYYTQRWPLLIDPHGQAMKWICDSHKDRKIRIFKPSDQDLFKYLSSAVSNGDIAVLKDIPEELDPSLDNLISRKFSRQNSGDFILIDYKKVVWNPEFKLFVLTSEKYEKFSPELKSKFTIVDFSLSGEGLEQKLLTLLISMERPELEEKKQLLASQSAANQRQGHNLEDKILHVLTTSCGNILEDETATRTLYVSKTQAEDIKSKQLDIAKARDEIEEIRHHYRPVASLGAAAFSAVAKLRNLNTFYQFSMEYLTSLYKKSIIESRRSAVIAERVYFITEHLTKNLYLSVCWSLFRKDRIAFGITLALAVLRDKRDDLEEVFSYLSAGEFSFQLNLSPAAAPPTWISEESWVKIQFISQKFLALKNLPLHVQSNSEKWRKFCKYSLDNQSLPKPYNESHPLEQLLIFQAIKPECLFTAFKVFLRDVLGPGCLDTPTNDLDDVYDSSVPSFPVLCITADQGDPVSQILSLCDSKTGTKNKVKFLAMAPNQVSTTLTFLRRCMFEGSWAVIQNFSFCPELLTVVLETLDQESDELHPEFRLWLLCDFTFTPPNHFIENSLKIVFEPPANFRDSMLEILKTSSFDRRTSSKDCDEEAKPSEDLLETEKWNRILFCLFCFHSLLVERNKYGKVFQVDWSDLNLAMELLHENYSKNEDLSVNSIRSVIKGCVYGVRVTTGEHEEILQKFINAVFVPSFCFNESVCVSLCGAYKIPFALNRGEKIEFLRGMPSDLGPQAVGISLNSLETESKQMAYQILEKIKRMT